MAHINKTYCLLDDAGHYIGDKRENPPINIGKFRLHLTAEVKFFSPRPYLGKPLLAESLPSGTTAKAELREYKSVAKGFFLRWNIVIIGPSALEVEAAFKMIFDQLPIIEYAEESLMV